MANSSGSHAAARGKSRTAARKARATQRNRTKKWSAGREIFVTSMGCVGIVFGVLFIAASVGFWYGSQMILGILHEVGEKDFTAQYERINKYEVFFDGLSDAGYDVIREEPKIDTKPDSSAKFYLWRVQPAGTSEFCIYRWRYDLQSDKVEPKTNPALLLDIQMGYVKRDDAKNYGFYDPSDELAEAIAEDNLGLVQLQALGSGWESDTLPEGPVMAPAVPVEEAEGREARARHPEGEGTQGSEAGGSQDAVAVGDDGGGSGGEGNDGSADNNGGATEVGDR